MSIFYYDNVLMVAEKNYEWDNALLYLEQQYQNTGDIQVLCSLIGFSWYYLIEGGVDSRKYGEDTNYRALDTWKKYIDLSKEIARQNPFVSFITGYTLSLHGFYIGLYYEEIGNTYMKTCLDTSDDTMLQQLASNFLLNEHSKKYVPLRNGREICAHFFDGSSLLDQYFREMYMNTRITS